MSVDVAGMSAFIGAGASDDALILACLTESVELLTAYLRHLRQIDRTTDPATVTGEIVATFDQANNRYTWADSRTLDVDDPTGLVPVSVLDRATQEVCSDLFTRRNAPNGILNVQFAGADGGSSAPARLHRDPLTPAYPLLSRWTVPF